MNKEQSNFLKIYREFISSKTVNKPLEFDFDAVAYRKQQAKYLRNLAKQHKNR